MLKKRTKNWKILFFLLIFVISSCRKEPLEDISSNPQTFSTKTDKTMMVKDRSDAPIIAKWLSLHESNLKKSEKNLFNEIVRTLDYSKLHIETRKNGENLIIIPIDNSVVESINRNADYLKFNSSTIFNLLIIQGTSGKLRWSTLIGYNAEDGSNKTSLTEKTIQNILNGESVSDNGLYKFVNLKGRLQYQLTYKEGKLHSSASPVREDHLEKNKSRKSSGVAARGGCFAYYLVTTIYYSDGHTEQWEEYLFTACDEDTDEGGGGGGGDVPGEEVPDPENPEEPNDQEITVHGSEDVWETAFVNEDYQTPITTDIPAEMDLDENGNPYPPVSLPMPVKYSHTWYYTKLPVFPFLITGIYMNDATVHPAHLTYQTAQGSVTRNINLIGQIKTATSAGDTANLRWKYDVATRYTNTTIGETTTTTRPKYFYKTVPF